MAREDEELTLQRLVKSPKVLEQPSIIVDVEGRTIDIHSTFKPAMCQASGLV